MSDWKSRIIESGAVDPTTLDPHPMNWREHPEAQAAALEGALDRIGWIQQVVVNKRTGRMLDGHLRVELARKHCEPLVPVLYVDIDDEEEQIALLTLDPIAALATANAERLEALIRDIGPQAPAVQKMIDDLAKANRASLAALEDDETPDPPKKPVTKPGDLWILGDHRLLCGDATSSEDVLRLLDGEKPLLTVTDPPYGVNYDPSWRNEAAAKGQLSYAASRIGKVANDDRADWRAAWDHCPGDVIYAWSAAGRLCIDAGLALESAGFVIRNQIIWRKPNFPISRGHYTYQHEPCWYAVRKGATAHWCGSANASSVWEFPLDKNVEGGHSTQKPLEAMGRPMRNHVCESVLDPFVGSGTTLIAAEKLGRRCFAMDIDPAYCDVTVARWENVTGKKAERDRSKGQT